MREIFPQFTSGGGEPRWPRLDGSAQPGCRCRLSIYLLWGVVEDSGGTNLETIGTQCLFSDFIPCGKNCLDLLRELSSVLIRGQEREGTTLSMHDWGMGSPVLPGRKWTSSCPSAVTLGQPLQPWLVHSAQQPGSDPGYLVDLPFLGILNTSMDPHQHP